MKNLLLTISMILCSLGASAQVVINEIDTDTPSTDELEFIELKATPGFSLNGYVMVCFNGGSGGTGNVAYYTMSLNGITTDINGLALIGNNLVAPVPDDYLPVSTFQNGPDAIAIYSGVEADYPMGFVATTTNLIDALVYNTNSTTATQLIADLGVSTSISENVNSQITAQSIQRKSDGTYEAKAPTPGVLNDGSGTLFNGITISTVATEYNEGDVFAITFTTQNPVTSPLNFNFSLNSGGFNTSDYTGVTAVSIATGNSTFTTNITLVDDVLDEGDELAKINFGTIPSGYKRMNENVEVRIIDNDFTTAAWGTPLNPTYGIVDNLMPEGYYTSLEGKTGQVLKQAIQDLIANPEVIHAHNYGDVTDILKEADQNPENSNQVWLMYVEQGRAKYRFQTTASSTGSWNREHIYPQSRGGFSSGTDSTPDGINVWLPSNADDILAGHGDAHHIRSEDGPENSSRNNKDYGLSDYNGPVGNQGSWHGDVARSVFYMACRYNGLSVVNGNPPDSTDGELGDLATLLVWNTTDTSDDFEMNRNNIVYTWQQNRNPFIDHPDLADHIWGASVGLPWFSSLSTDDHSQLQVGVYPNPAKDQITISGVMGEGKVVIYNLSGMELYTSDFNGDTTLRLNLTSGMYLAKITSENKASVKKLLIK